MTSGAKDQAMSGSSDERSSTPEQGQEESTGKSADRIQVIGASVRGPGHDEPGGENEDAYETRWLADDTCIIAVADGLGSAPAGGRGARITTEAATEAAANELENISSFGSETDKRLETRMTEVVEAAIRKAREAVEEEAENKEIPVGDLASTLLVVLLADGHLTAGHIGDGAVIAQIDEKLHFVSRPGETEYVNQVVPLTSANWEESVRVNQDEIPDAVAVFTDGLRRAGLKQTQDGDEPFPGFFDPVFSYIKSAEDSSRARSDLEELLRSEKLSEHSSDDKTLVMGFRNEDE